MHKAALIFSTVLHSQELLSKALLSCYECSLDIEMEEQLRDAWDASEVVLQKLLKYLASREDSTNKLTEDK